MPVFGPISRRNLIRAPGNSVSTGRTRVGNTSSWSGRRVLSVYRILIRAMSAGICWHGFFARPV